MSDKPDALGRQMPIQKSRLLPRESATVNEAVYMQAYKVYSRVWGPQQAMIEGHCRGGFSVDELVAFLYAGNFPESEWYSRFEEACKGLKV